MSVGVRVNVRSHAHVVVIERLENMSVGSSCVAAGDQLGVEMG